MTLTTIKRAGLDGEALDRVFTIGASGSSAYTFQGEGLNGTVNNPTLYLTRGKTYRFENGSGGHPIRIQSTSGASGTAYNTGVTNNAGSGTVIVEVQHDAPDVLYYQCTSHAAMNGILYITGALADGGVTSAKLANNAVVNGKIADGAVTDAKINVNINGSKLTDDSVTQAKLADDAVGTDQIASGSITSARLANDAVTQAKIAANAVDTTELAVGAVTHDQLADNTVDADHLQSNAVTTAKIADNAVNMNKLSDLDNGRIIARVSSGSGNPEAATAAQVRTLLNVADGATNSPTITINGNTDHYLITGTGTANTLSGDSSAQWNGTSLTLNKSANAYLNPDLNLYNSYNGGWGAGITFSGKYGGNKETQARIRTYGGQNANDASLAFETGNPNEIIRLLPTGGITFNGDTSTSNALDDYEEGTFTPELGGSSNFSSYHAQGTGRYTKIGRLVDVHMAWSNIDISNSASGDAQIGGLPFTSSNFEYTTTTDHYLQHAGFHSSKIQSWYVNTNTTTMGGIESQADSQWNGWTVSNFHASGIYLRIHLTYMAA